MYSIRKYEGEQINGITLGKCLMKFKRNLITLFVQLAILHVHDENDFYSVKIVIDDDDDSHKATFTHTS